MPYGNLKCRPGPTVRTHRPEALDHAGLLGLHREPARPEQDKQERSQNTGGYPPASETAEAVPQFLEHLLGIIMLLHGPSPFCKGLPCPNMLSLCLNWGAVNCDARSLGKFYAR